MITFPVCNHCGVPLTDDNWYPSFRKRNRMACKECNSKQASLWRMNNRDKAKAAWTRHSRKIGTKPFDKNKECSQYLGIHIAERLLIHMFNDVVTMPMNNKGYDFVCNTGKKIDVKSACLFQGKIGFGRWGFNINRNTIADYFLCISFDNRDDLIPRYLWLVPGHILNHLSCTSISESTIDKWDEYRLDIDKVITCCNAMKEGDI